MVITSERGCCDKLTYSSAGTTPGIHQRAVSGWRHGLTQAAVQEHAAAYRCSSQQPNFIPAAAVNESIGTVKQKKGGESVSVGPQEVVGGWGRRGQHHPFSQAWPAELRGSTCSCCCWEQPSKLTSWLPCATDVMWCCCCQRQPCLTFPIPGCFSSFMFSLLCFHCCH